GGTDKPGFKVDINHVVVDQAFNGLKKMSFENGIGSSQDCGGGDGGGASSLMTEYLGWRIHVLGGHVTGRAAFAKVYVNGDYIGTYVNVEQPDKVFLRKRLGDNDGWLYKVSGGDDGYKTNETTANPYEDDFCFLRKNPCPAPADLENVLPGMLDIEQVLKVGAANALIGNHDGIILKLNNYYAYDYASGPRVYLPWDLDSTMSDDYDVFTGTVSGGTTVFTDVLFAHWEDDYDRILTDWLAGPLSIDAIRGEIDRAVDVAGQAMADDPNGGGSAAAAGSDLEAWWNARHAQVSEQVAAH
ncbi:MAG TPA: CotH kinase family protein, partial [Kofleriaceae bacterium]|nr:CotH kinase family protein [Kofleriaceae bacterium]